MTYGLPDGGRGDAPSDDAGQDDDREEVRQGAEELAAGMAPDATVAQVARSAGWIRMAMPRASREHEQQRAPNAPIGVQRPKMTAARRDEPAAGRHPVLERPVDSRVSQAPARPAKTPPRMTLR